MAGWSWATMLQRIQKTKPKAEDWTKTAVRAEMAMGIQARG